VITVTNDQKARSAVSQAPAPRPRGRPREFDRDDALARAAETFWRLGYEGASIADLTAAMGITAQSLYAAFTSKANLYREALGWYRNGLGAAAGAALAQPDVVEALEGFLTIWAHEYCRPGRPAGCMIATATLTCAVENRLLAEHLSSLRDAGRKRIRERIEQGVREGQLRPDTDAAALARFVGALVQGMSVQAKDGATEEELRSIVTHGVAQIARHRRR
jgi:AcrR family transcriptional regulator